MTERPPTCARWDVELANAASLDELGAEAKAHLETCAGCQEVFERSRIFWALGRERILDGVPAASPGLKLRVLAAAAASSPKAEPAPLAKVLRPARWQRPMAWIALAAAAALVGWLLLHPRATPRQELFTEGPHDQVGFGLTGNGSDAGLGDAGR